MAGDQVSGPAPVPWHALTSPERELAKQAAIGKFWTPNGLDGDLEDIDPSKSETWGEGRTIGANVIRHLAVGDTWTDVRGPSTAGTGSLLVRGALITGELDLRGLKLTRDIWLEKCAFDHIVQLSDCKTKTVSLSGSRLNKGLRAKRAHIKGGLYLNSGFVAEGEVNLEDVTIEGNLDCGGGEFIFKKHKDDKFALMADNAKIGGDVRLNVLSIGDAIADPKTRFSASGEVHFVGARVFGNFDCNGGEFHNGKEIAINANGLSCRNLFLGEGFDAEGTTDFLGLRTVGQVSCIGGKFSNKDKLALGLRFAEIGSSLFFDAAEGDTSANPHAAICGTLDLSQATCRIYRDSEKSWPQSGELLLDGFTYQCFHECPSDWRSRQTWLNLQRHDRTHGTFHPQPWTQAIKVLRDMGYETDSIELAICRERALAHCNRWPISIRLGPWKRSIAVNSPGIGFCVLPLAMDTSLGARSDCRFCFS